MAESQIPSAFVWRRIHSIFGLFLVGFLFVHLLTNAQAALFVGNDGEGFIHHVNQIHALPFLPVIEIGGLGLLFAFHAVLGVRYLFSAKPNSGGTDGSKPSLGEFPRNRAYTWQRITSWLLVFAIVAHVVHMRINRYPINASIERNKQHIVKVSMDRGLYTVADRLGVDLFDSESIAAARLALPEGPKEKEIGESGPISLEGFMDPLSSEPYNEERQERLKEHLRLYEKRHKVKTLEKIAPGPTEVAAVAPDIGTAILLTVRDCFKYPFLIFLYTLFVPITTFHACNGLWTGLITWGITLTERSQQLAKNFCLFLMAALTFMGWAAVWGTYWINLRY